MQVTATQAKNQFGFFCAQAKKAPVFVEKGGRVDSVIVSAAQFATLQAAGQTKSMAQRKREFNQTYKDWIEEQNRHFEKHGLWCNGLVSWTDE